MTPVPQLSRYDFKLSALILMGAVEISREQIGCSESTWQRLVKAFRLIRATPRFGRSNHWVRCASGESQRHAHLIRTLGKLLKQAA